MNDPSPQAPVPLFGSLLDDRLLNYRKSNTGERTAATLPELFVAMAKDEVRDFPALRPHQRHPWHAFLVQLAAIALHRAGQAAPFGTAGEWRSALLALSPDDPDGAAWCLVSPVDRPAFMQAPEPSGSISAWKNVCTAADELDMLVTSKNHDLKARRMLASTPEDWVYALISLQTQEGFLGAGNYGISRMSDGHGNRWGIGIHPNGGWGKRWDRDLQALSAQRTVVAQDHGFQARNPLGLVWLQPWDGASSLSFTSLDPWYIEICRRVRMTSEGALQAHQTGSKASRIAAKERKGVTGDPWTPVDLAKGQSLKIDARGFDYKRSAQLLLGSTYSKPVAQTWLTSDDPQGVHLLLQGLARGKGKTEGYHERRIPISRKVGQGLMKRQTDELARRADDRIKTIGGVQEILQASIVVLLGNGAEEKGKTNTKAVGTAKKRAGVFAQPFEAECDAQFFVELFEEIEADDRDTVRTQWLQALAARAERVLRAAFIAGPRNGQLRYRAQAAALSRLHGAMRGKKLPALALALKSQSPKEETHELI